MDIRPIAPAIGAEIVGIDLAGPLAEAETARIRAAWLDRGILLFRGQAQLTPEQFIAASRRFGPLDAHDLPDYCLPGHPEIAVVSNVKEGGRYIGAPKAGRHWHSDSQYLRRPPSASLLLAREAPPAEGDTLFATMVAAYDALDDEMKRRIADLRIEHSRVRAYSRFHPERPPLTPAQIAELPDVRHPLVRTHPETGRKALYVGGAQHGGRVVGLPQDEGDALITELRDFATQPRFVHAHRWTVGDLIVWDNRSTMHCALPFDEERHRRVMHRTQIVGDIPV